MKKRLKAFMLANTILALVAISVCAFSLMLTIPSMFGALEAEDLSLRAMQYAEVDAKIVKLLNYDDLSDDDVLIAAKLHTDRAEIETINADGWEDELIIGPEQVMGDGENLYRIATVNIYRAGDTVPRATLEVPLSSQRAGGQGIGNALIVSGYLKYGEQIPIPEGYTEEECIWFISPYTTIRAWHGDARHFYYSGFCYVDENRINKSYSTGDGADTLPIYYLLIAIHGAKVDKSNQTRILDF